MGAKPGGAAEWGLASFGDRTLQAPYRLRGAFLRDASRAGTARTLHTHHGGRVTDAALRVDSTVRRAPGRSRRSFRHPDPARALLARPYFLHRRRRSQRAPHGARSLPEPAPAGAGARAVSRVRRAGRGRDDVV